jgi:hypothetical protein
MGWRLTMVFLTLAVGAAVACTTQPKSVPTPTARPIITRAEAEHAARLYLRNQSWGILSPFSCTARDYDVRREVWLVFCETQMAIGQRSYQHTTTLMVDGYSRKVWGHLR